MRNKANRAHRSGRDAPPLRSPPFFAGAQIGAWTIVGRAQPATARRLAMSLRVQHGTCIAPACPLGVIFRPPRGPVRCPLLLRQQTLAARPLKSALGKADIRAVVTMWCDHAPGRWRETALRRPATQVRRVPRTARGPVPSVRSHKTRDNAGGNALYPVRRERS